MVVASLVLALTLIGCAEKDVGSDDSGSVDGGTADGGTSDGGTTDGGTTDGGTTDGGTTDGGTEDADGDGWIAGEGPAEDCDDRDDSVHPGAEDLCTDGIDSDCDGWDGTEDCNGEVSGAAWHVVTRSEFTHMASLGDPGDITGDGTGDLFVGLSEYEHDRGLRCVEGRLVPGPVEHRVDLDGGDSVSVADACYATGCGDMTGDGYDDVIATSVDDNESYTAWIVPGPIPSGGRLDSSAGVTLRSVAGATSGSWGANASLGDLDGDGIDDVVVYLYDTLALYTGPIVTERPSPDAQQDDSTDASFEDQHLESAVVLGDTDGDGIADLGVSWSHNAAMQLYLGPVAEGLDSFAWDRAVGVSGGTWVGGDDLDGDGYQDVVVADGAWRSPDTATHAVTTFRGPLSTEVSAADAHLVITGDGDAEAFSRAAALTGDWDGDGAQEIAVSDPDALAWGGGGTGRVTVYSGASAGTLTPDDAIARAAPRSAPVKLGTRLLGGLALDAAGGDTSLVAASDWIPRPMDDGTYLYGLVLRPPSE